MPAPIEKPSLYLWRYALNENVDGHSSPYWNVQRWQREIHILAMSGIDAILIERGTDIVLYQTFSDAGYSDEAICEWIAQPVHQNWELMGNIHCFEEPISTHNYWTSDPHRLSGSSLCYAALISLRFSRGTMGSSCGLCRTASRVTRHHAR